MNGEPAGAEIPPAAIMPGAGTLESLLRENLALAKENNRMLRRMKHIGRWAFWTKVVVWALVLGLPVLFIGPILDSLKESARSSTFLGIPSADELEKAFGQYRSSTTGQ